MGLEPFAKFAQMQITLRDSLQRQIKGGHITENGRDGVADALGIDDKRFVCHPFVSEEIGGMVKIRVTGGPQ